MVVLSQVPRPSNLVEVSRFAEHNLAITLERLRTLAPSSASLADIAEAARTLSMSTAFSGVGFPEQTHVNCCNTLASHLQEAVKPGLHLWAIEPEPANQQELLVSPGRPQCIHSDVRDAIQAKVRHMVSDASFSWDDMLRLFVKNNIMTDMLPCVVHCGGGRTAGRRLCRTRRAKLHVAGTECVAFSSQGQQQRCHHERFILFFIWAAHRRLTQEEFILHENVPNFPVRLLIDALGDLYFLVEDLSSAVFSSFQLGDPYDRRRRWTWLVHKRGITFNPIQELVPSWSVFIERYFRECVCDWSNYYWQDEESTEYVQELCAAQKLRSKKPTPIDTLTPGQLARYNSSPFYATLTTPELTWAFQYLENLCGENGVCLLNQDPGRHPIHNRGSNRLPTILKHPDKYWSFKHGRWMFPQEVLVVHNMPMKVGQFGAPCSFQQSRSLAGLPARRRNWYFQVVGNGMSMSQVDVCLQWLLTVMCLSCHHERQLALFPVAIHTPPSAVDDDSLLEDKSTNCKRLRLGGPP